MNIFVLALDPKKAAQYHNDRHCVKMVLETTQLLSTAIPYLCSSRLGPYKSNHLNHPCSKWARECTGNYYWLWQLGIELCKEYTKRYNKIHACSVHIKRLALNIPISNRTPFAKAMPDQYKHKNIVKAYRDYYIGEKRHIANWKTIQPDWWI